MQFDPARVDELLEQSRKQLATLVPISDRAAAIGDVAVVSFSGVFSDTDEPISGGSAESLEVELEVGRMIPGFVEGIVGLTLGAETEVNCQFPSDYPDETCRGRGASFKISLNDLKAKELPSLDDAFAQQASDKETLAELRTELETRLKADADKRQKINREQALLKALVAELEVEIPESLIKEEVNTMLQETAAEMSRQGMDINKLFTPELVRNLASKSREEATERLRGSLALQALAKAEAIAVEDLVLEAKLKEVIRGLSDTNRIDHSRLRAAVAEDLLKEAVFSWLEENATIKISKNIPEKVSSADESSKKPAAKAKGKAKPID